MWTEKCTFEERILSTIPHVDGDGMQEFCPKRNEDGQIAVYLVEFSCLEYGLIGAVVKDIQRLYRIIREYLEWTNANKDYEGLYLEYGASALPSCFAVNELFCLFAEICPPLKEVSQEQKDYELQGSGSHCTFCGRKTIFTHKLQDGRRMCNYCKNHQLTARQEIKEMFYETKSFLEKQYNIKIPDNLHIKFKSATAIKNKLGYDGEGRVLGFYHDGSKQVWIESRGPKICVQSTLMHELTHGWQYPHIDMAEIRRHPMYGLDLIEGHTSYVEVEGMKYLKEYDYSQFLHEGLMRRNDEYGNGYRMVCALMELGREQKGNSYTVYQLMSDISKSIAMGVSLEEIWNE